MNSSKEVLERKRIKRTWWAVELGKLFYMVNGYVQSRLEPRLEELFDITKILDVEITELLVDPKRETHE